MGDQQLWTGLPNAYALSIWLRGVGCNEEQIASVLGVDPEAVGPMLDIAELKLARLRRTSGDGSLDRHIRSVATFVGGDDRTIDAAADLAKDGNALLHLIGVTAGTCLVPTVVQAARRAVARGADVVPHALIGDKRSALETVAERWGLLTLVTRCANLDVPSGVEVYQR